MLSDDDANDFFFSEGILFMLMYHISHSGLKGHWEIESLFDLEFLLCNFYQLHYYKFYMYFKNWIHLTKCKIL